MSTNERIAVAAPAPQEGINGSEHIAYPHPDAVLNFEDSPNNLWHVSLEPGSHQIGKRVVGAELLAQPGLRLENYNGPTRLTPQAAAHLNNSNKMTINSAPRGGRHAATKPYGILAKLIKKDASAPPRYRGGHRAK
jgi:hypothetical protein